MRDVVIVSAARTAIGRAPRGVFRQTRPDDLAAAAVAESLKRAVGVEASTIDDVVLGCATPEAEQGMNIARIAGIRAGLPVSVPGLTVNRFCASGLEAIAIAAAKIATGTAEIVIAGGAESMSMVPFMGASTRPNPTLMETQPDTYLGMGPAVEALGREFGVTRAECDAFALESHRRAIAAQDAGLFDSEIVPVCVRISESEGDSVTVREQVVAKDEGPRRETSAEALGGLKPAFLPDGLITAGNASQRSDGAAAVLLMSADMAARLGIAPLARFVGYAVAAVAPERFGIGPAIAIPRLLKQTGISLDDVGLIEFNEAFAAQVLACGLVYPLPMERVNVNGGAIALGHPLGATGARQLVTLLNEGRRRGVRYGIVTMCAALGMGAAGLFELM